MSAHAISVVLTISVLAVLAVWVPLLEAVACFARREQPAAPGSEPNRSLARAEDEVSGPQAGTRGRRSAA